MTERQTALGAVAQALGRAVGRLGSLPGLCAVVLPLLIVIFWRTRVVWGAPDLPVGMGSLDLYLSYFLRTQHLFERLGAGELPLWNPYQLAGQPLAALPASGLFYPPNWLYLAFGVPVGIEVQFLLHAWIGGVGMLLLGKQLGFGRIAGLGGSVTFVGSGFATGAINQPVLFAGFMWLPVILWQIVRVMERRRGGVAGLAAALAMGFLTGATEVLLHGLLAVVAVAAALLLCAPGHNARRLAAAVGACSLAVGLCAVQLLPAWELVSLSVRAPGALSPEQALRTFPYFWVSFERSLLGLGGPTWLGLLPVVLVGFGFQRHRARPVIFALAILGLLALSLVVDGPVARAYVELPVIGSLFRRTIKFADVYSLCGSVVAMAALQGLVTLGRRSPQERWRALALWLALGLAGLLAFRAISLGVPVVPLVGLVGLLCLWTFLPSRRVAEPLVAGFVLLQAVQLGLAWRMPASRPIERPDWASVGAGFFERLRDEETYGRTFIAREVVYSTSFAAKRGMAHRVLMLADYEPLTPRRQAEYFTFASRAGHPLPFEGNFSLGVDARWPLIRLAGAQNFIVASREASSLLKHGGTPLVRSGNKLPRLDVTVLRDPRDPPMRAYFAARVRAIQEPRTILETLASPGFDLAREVVLESQVEGLSEEQVGPDPVASVAIAAYEPERVVLQVETDQPGVVVLTDLYFPGWEVRVDGEEREVLRANYLFRGVEVEAGRKTVVFTYEPVSLYRGMAVTLLSLVTLGLLIHRARGAEPA